MNKISSDFLRRLRIVLKGPEMAYRDLYEALKGSVARLESFNTPLADISCSASSYNQMCGDKIVLDCHINDRQVVDVHVQATGCLLSRAGISLLLEMLMDKEIQVWANCTEGDIIQRLPENFVLSGSRKSCFLMGLEVVRKIAGMNQLFDEGITREG